MRYNHAVPVASSGLGIPIFSGTQPGSFSQFRTTAPRGIPVPMCPFFKNPPHRETTNARDPCLIRLGFPSSVITCPASSHGDNQIWSATYCADAKQTFCCGEDLALDAHSGTQRTCPESCQRQHPAAITQRIWDEPNRVMGGTAGQGRATRQVLNEFLPFSITDLSLLQQGIGASGPVRAAFVNRTPRRLFKIRVAFA